MKEAIVIPIPNPVKYSTNPGKYSPVALTSCIYKTMERMIDLFWFHKKEKLILHF